MRILILSSSTGGGHDMRARALESWCKRLSTEENPIETFRYQALEESAGLYKFGVNLYNRIQKKCPWAHHLYFNWLEIFQISASARLLLGKSKYIAKLQSIKPDLIVSVHAHTNHAFRKIAQHTLPKLKFVTYCGEMHGGYGFSRHWVDREADSFIGATPEICESAIRMGMPPENTTSGGFLLHPSFFGPEPQPDEISQLREALHLRDDRPTLLLSTGANGALNHLTLLKAMEKAGLEVQVIALCGKNSAARQSIESWSQAATKVKACALDFRKDIFQLMHIADLVVARPGTGTTSEAIMAHCPILLNTLGGVMPQEWITVKFLRSRGMEAARIKKPTDIIPQLKKFTENRQQLADFRANFRKLRPTSKPDAIVEHLRSLVFH